MCSTTVPQPLPLDSLLPNIQVLRDCSFEESNSGNEKKVKKESGNPVVLQKAVVEKKLSVLRSALKDNPNSVLLMTKKLNVLAEVSDPEIVDREWKDLVGRFPNDVVVLKSYVRFLSTQFSTFSVVRIVAALASCVEKFRALKASREDHILFIVQLVANIWKNAGIEDGALSFPR